MACKVILPGVLAQDSWQFKWDLCISGIFSIPVMQEGPRNVAGSCIQVTKEGHIFSDSGVFHCHSGILEWGDAMSEIFQNP